MIRFANLEDTAELLEIYRPYIENTVITFEYDVPTLKEYRERIAEIVAFYPYLVWEEDGKLLGYAYAHRHMARAAYQWNVELSIYLRQDATRKGIGKKLCTAILELLKLQGIKTAYSCVTVPNPASEGLHAAMGFRDAGIWRNSGYKDGKWRDVAWFDKQILPYEVNPEPPISIHDVAPEKIAEILSAF